jgi:hypothetical protein
MMGCWRLGHFASPTFTAANVGAEKRRVFHVSALHNPPALGAHVVML